MMLSFSCVIFIAFFSLLFQPVTSSAVYILGEIVASKMDIAQPLVRVFMHHNQIVPIIRTLANAEISNLT